MNDVQTLTTRAQGNYREMQKFSARNTIQSKLHITSKVVSRRQDHRSDCSVTTLDFIVKKMRFVIDLQ